VSLLRNTAVQAGMTLLSRILGFVRDIVILAKLGAGPVADAFVTAQQFPNLFRRIFAEGAFSQAFVPAYSRTLEAEGPEAARAVAQEALRGLFAITALVTVLAQLAMPWIMLVLHAGYRDDTVHFPLAIWLTQITMPYLACMALAALLSGVLNAAGRFALSAGAPTLLNVCLLGAAFIGQTPTQVATALCVAITVAGVAQLALLWWGVGRQRVRLSLGWPKLTPAVKKIAALAIPGVIAGSGTQINLLVTGSLASFEAGAKTWLYSADRLYQLPLGLVGVAVGLAILPRLSRAARAEDGAAGNRIMDDGIGLSMALTLPAAAALMCIPFLLSDGFFTRGGFTSEDARQTASALFHFAWGVPAFVLIKVLAPAFFAREDTTTPMNFALISVFANTALGAGLFFGLKAAGLSGFPGLAVATSVAAWLNVVLMQMSLSRRGWYRPGAVLRSRMMRVGLATLAMAGFLLGAQTQAEAIAQALWGSRFLAAAAVGLAGFAVYALAALVFGAVRLSEVRSALRR
jgi:putative peptidoglycan lipid II flippase